MAKARIVLADDELNLRRVLGAMLAREGYEVLEARDGEEALGLVGAGVAALITDLRMPRMDGMALLRRMAVEHSDVPVIMLTAHGSVDSAVEAVKLGAFDYIEKPFEQSQIRQIVDKAIRTHQRKLQSPRLFSSRDGDGRFGLVGRSASLEQVFGVIEKVADTPSTVLLSGESGTGKELVARALHAHSSRREGPFIAINCAAIPKTLIESELFGYDRGAFTGAVAAKPGRFELADKRHALPRRDRRGPRRHAGEAPARAAGVGLRARRRHQDAEGGRAPRRRDQPRSPQGGRRPATSARISSIASTSCPLHLPPLRDRKEDIPLLVSHFLARFNERLKKHVESIAPEALERLINHAWPGNIRELENVLERSILFADGPVLKIVDLPREAAPDGLSAAPVAAVDAETERSAAPAESLKDLVRRETERVERDLIRQALEETDGNVTQAARRLKISRKSLQTKMKEFGLRDRE